MNYSQNEYFENLMGCFSIILVNKYLLPLLIFHIFTTPHNLLGMSNVVYIIDAE